MGAPGGCFCQQPLYLGYYENRVLSSGHHILQDRKNIRKQKSSPLMRGWRSVNSDLSYNLKCGLQSQKMCFYYCTDIGEIWFGLGPIFGTYKACSN